jgi:hypothetical protein
MSDSVTWIAEGVEGRDSRDRKTHIRRAYVVTDAAKDSVTVLAVQGVPAIGAAHPSYATALVVDRRARNLGNGFEWEIDVEYERDTSPNAPSKKARTSATVAAEIPTDEPWEFDQDFHEIEVTPSSLAIATTPGGSLSGTGDPSVNTAGELFADPVTETIYAQVLILEKNIETGDISPSIASTYHGSVNSASVAVAGVTIPARCGWMRRCVVRKRYYGDANTAYWRARFEIVVYPSDITTDLRVWQRGYNELDGTDLVPIYAPDGQGVRTPQLLDSAGAATTTPYARYYARTKRESWASLNLPTTI